MESPGAPNPLADIMHHVITPPCPQLAPFVRCFWAFEAPDIPAQLEISTFVNDSTGMTFVSDKMNPLFRAVVEGQTTRPVAFRPVSSISAFGVQFHTGAMHRLFGFEASAVTDNDVAVSDVADPHLADAVLNAETMAKKIDVVTRFLSRLVARGKAPDPLVTHVIEKMRRCHGTLRIAELTREYGISERQLERKFSAIVGVSPKHYQKVMRFQRALALFKQYPVKRLTDVGLESGYYDQAHFIRDVKQLAGETPNELRSRLLALPVNQKGSTRYLIRMV